MKEIGPETAFYFVAVVTVAIIGIIGLVLLATGGVQ